MFLLQPNGSGSLDVDAIRDHLESIGESVLVAGDSRALKVHVHNERPDLVVGYGLSLGALSRISIENLDNQARDVRETRAAAFTGAEATARAATAAAADARDGRSPTDGARPSASSPSSPATAWRRSSATSASPRSSRAASRPTRAPASCSRRSTRVDAREVIVLPNNPNVVLAARQVAAMADRPVVVVPTRNAAEGFAALLALDPSLDAAANAGPMTEAGRAIQTLVVTEAVRDATIGGRKVKRGQTIALDPDDGLVASAATATRRSWRRSRRSRPGFELLTLFYGDGADLAEAEAMARRIGAVTPGVEVEVRHGGQPFYRYLIAAE